MTEDQPDDVTAVLLHWTRVAVAVSLPEDERPARPEQQRLAA